MNDTVRDLVAGTTAGTTAKFFEFPMDTVKVRVQAHPTLYTGYFNCAASIFHNEGFKGFFRGLAAPVLGAGAENGMLFAGFGMGQRLYSELAGVEPEVLRHGYHFPSILTSGAVAGIAVSHVLTPVELLKCKMQVENVKPVSERLYHGVFDCAAKCVRAEGITSLFRGHTATLAREIPGNAAWFGFYNLSLKMLTPEGKTKDDLPKWKVAISGSMGGFWYWTAFFPADVVKTLMQTSPRFAKVSLPAGLKIVYREQGFKGLYAGWSITIARAIPANAIIFSIYEMVTKQWDESAKRNHHHQEKGH